MKETKHENRQQIQFGRGGSGHRFENERIRMAFFPLLFPHRFRRRRAFVSRRLFYKTTIETVVLRALSLYIHVYIYTYVCKIRYRRQPQRTTGGGGPDAACSKDQKGGDPEGGHKGQTRCKEIGKSRTPMQPPNQSSIHTIDSLRFQPADYLISTPLLDPPSSRHLLPETASPLSRSRLILVDAT